MNGFSLKALIGRAAVAAALSAMVATLVVNSDAAPADRGVVGTASRNASADFSELARREQGRPLPSAREMPARPKLRSLAALPQVDPSLVVTGRPTRAVFGSAETVPASEPVADGEA